MGILKSCVLAFAALGLVGVAPGMSYAKQEEKPLDKAKKDLAKKAKEAKKDIDKQAKEDKKGKSAAEQAEIDARADADKKKIDEIEVSGCEVLQSMATAGGGATALNDVVSKLGQLMSGVVSNPGGFTLAGTGTPSINWGSSQGSITGTQPIVFLEVDNLQWNTAGVQILVTVKCPASDPNCTVDSTATTTNPGATLPGLNLGPVTGKPGCFEQTYTVPTQVAAEGYATCQFITIVATIKSQGAAVGGGLIVVHLG